MKYGTASYSIRMKICSDRLHDFKQIKMNVNNLKLLILMCTK